ncbi:MAG: class I SAM-dependent methyltransferase [Acidobacteria bacterium]|nr:class I SAM-dependent methyltransferase [Acidobacteriota bacterium]
MSLWKLERVPETEVMDETAEVESYSTAAAERHLDAIDNTFVEHVLRLVPPDSHPAWGLDVGTGPGQIPIKILRRIPGLKIVGVDRSPTMLFCARQNAERAGSSNRLLLLVADGHSLPFPEGTFSLVLCNSVLHHAREPVQLLRELFRVAAPNAALLLRDLRRPSRPFLRWHLWRHGHHYHDRMRSLFDDSVRASYTLDELEGFLQQAQLPGARGFCFRRAHIGIERPASR